MNNIFSLKRIQLILRSNWIEHKKLFALSAGLFAISLFLLLWYAGVTKQPGIFTMGLIIALISYFNYLGKKVHHPKGLSLTLPASTLEKYTSLLLMLVFYVVAYLAIYGLILGVQHVLFGMEALNPFERFSFDSLSDKNRFSIGFLLFLTAYLFLAYIWIKKYTAGIAFGVLILVVAVFIRLYMHLFSLPFGSEYIEFIQSEALENTITFIVKYFDVMMSVTTIVLFYVAYLKLKEKEIK